MLPIWLGLAIYGVLLTIFPLALVLVLWRRIAGWQRISILVLACIFSCPGYFWLIFVDELWPPDMLPFNYPRYTVAALGYQVTYEQHYGGDYYETFFQVERADGALAYVFVDIDAERCWDMATLQRDQKVYFACRDTKPDSLVPYIDLKERTLFNGLTRQTVVLDNLTFRMP